MTKEQHHAILTPPSLRSVTLGSEVRLSCFIGGRHYISWFFWCNAKFIPEDIGSQIIPESLRYGDWGIPKISLAFPIIISERSLDDLEPHDLNLEERIRNPWDPVAPMYQRESGNSRSPR